MNTIVVIAVPDLMVSTRISDVARALGFTPVETALSTLTARVNVDTALIVIDIGQRGDWEMTIRTLKGASTTAHVPILTFGPHIDVDASRTAVAAGSDRLVTRGKFMAELPQLLEQTAHREQKQPTDN